MRRPMTELFYHDCKREEYPFPMFCIETISYLNAKPCPHTVAKVFLFNLIGRIVGSRLGQVMKLATKEILKSKDSRVMSPNSWEGGEPNNIQLMISYISPESIRHLGMD